MATSDEFDNVSVLLTRGASLAGDNEGEEAPLESPKERPSHGTNQDSNEKTTQLVSFEVKGNVRAHLENLESLILELTTSHSEISSKLRTTEESLQKQIKVNGELQSECEKLEKEIAGLSPSLQLFNKTAIELTKAKMNEQQLLDHLDKITQATLQLEKEAARLEEEEARSLDMEISSGDAQIDEVVAEYDADEAELESVCLAEIQQLTEENERMLAEEEQRNEETDAVHAEYGPLIEELERQLEQVKRVAEQMRDFDGSIGHQGEGDVGDS